jgi:DNA-damage-inducible protein J
VDEHQTKYALSRKYPGSHPGSREVTTILVGRYLLALPTGFAIAYILIAEYNIAIREENRMGQSTLNINFRMDADLKNNMEKVCRDLGLTLTAAFIIFATKVAREKRIPFEVAVDPFYSDQNMARLKKSIAQMESTRGTIDEVDVRD